MNVTNGRLNNPELIHWICQRLKLHQKQQDQLVERLTAQLHRPPPRNAFWRNPDQFSLFFGQGNEVVVDYRPSSGLLTETIRSNRPIVRQMNALHLNEAKGWWTWVADLFALAMIFLALSGMTMVRNRRTGLRGRGGALVGAGLLVPLLGWLLL